MFKSLSGKEFYSGLSSEGLKKTGELTKECFCCDLFLGGGSYIVYNGRYFCSYDCFDAYYKDDISEAFIEYDNQ